MSPGLIVIFLLGFSTFAYCNCLHATTSLSSQPHAISLPSFSTGEALVIDLQAGGLATLEARSEPDFVILSTMPGVEWVTVTTSESPQETNISSDTSTSGTSTASPTSTSSAQASSETTNPPTVQKTKDGIWTGAKVGLGVCIPLVVILALVVTAMVIRSCRQSRARVISTGKDRITTGTERSLMETDGSVTETDRSVTGTIRIVTEAGRTASSVGLPYIPYSPRAELSEAIPWKDRAMSIPEEQFIEVEGKVHRVPTVLRPGSVVLRGWRYDPKAYDLEMERSPISPGSRVEYPRFL